MNDILRTRFITYVILAVALRLILFSAFPAMLTGDSSGYLVASYHIRSSADFADASERAVMGPGYPAFLAITSPLTAMNSASVVLLQKFVGVLSMFLGYGIGRGLRSFLVAEGLALFLAFNPVFLLYEHVLSTETLFIFLLLAFTFAWLVSLRRGSVVLAVLAGLALGMAALTRANAVPYALVLAGSGFLWLLERSNKAGWARRVGHAARWLAAVALASALLIVPWLWLNFTVHERLALTNFNNRNLLIYKALHDPLDESLPEIREMNQILDTPFGNVWFYYLKGKTTAAEAETIARDLYLEQIAARPRQHVRQIGTSFLDFFGGYSRTGNELATVLFWVDKLVPNPKGVHELAQALMYQQAPGFRYVAAGEEANILDGWSKTGAFYLRTIRPLLALTAAGLSVVAAGRGLRHKVWPDVPVLALAAGFLATVTVHSLTLTTNDRYTTPFDWLLVLLLFAHLKSLLPAKPPARAVGDS